MDGLTNQLADALADGKRHTVYELTAPEQMGKCADIAYGYDWHVVTVWPQGASLMVLFKVRPR